MRSLLWWAAVVGLALAGCVDGGGDGGDPPEPDAEATPDTGDAAPRDDADVVGEECTDGETQPCGDDEGCAGTQTCVDGAFGECVFGAESCNGADDDCDGTTDEGFESLGDACSDGEGPCAGTGTVICNAAGDGTVCDAQAVDPGDEICNGADDDCDGAIDEGFDVAAVCTAGIGACAVQGLVVCRDGGAACDATPGMAVPELCNDLDDDCDGTTDERLGLGEACTVGLGACEAEGVIACDLDEEATCDAVPGVAVEETCNGIDDDCDGSTDEGFDVGAQCQAGQGQCADTGAIVCAPDGTARCEAQVAEPGDEVCNGLDDDCDGTTDEGFRVGQACSVGIGACAESGVVVCGDDGRGTCGAVPGAPAPEACNAVDDDCDGLADEGLGVDDACVVGVGACAAEGISACGEDGDVVCIGEPGAPGDEVCNGVDDDCDGALDEGFDPTGEVGDEVCDGLDQDCDGVVDEGFAPTGEQGAELCNGADDDCDGVIDEGVPGLGDVCLVGIGACQVDGAIACAPDGALICGGEPGAPADEVCNGVDDDCDGTVDEDFGVGDGCLVDGPCPRPGVVACGEGDAVVCAAERVGFGDGADGALVVADGEEVVLDRAGYAFTELTVQAGGRLTVAPFDPVARTGGRVEVRVAGPVWVEAGGVIDLTGRGWPGAAPNPVVARGYPGAWTNEGGSTGYDGTGPGAGRGGFAAPQATVGSGGGGAHATDGLPGVLCGVDQRDQLSVYDVNLDRPVVIVNPAPTYSAGGSAYADPEAALSMGSGGGGGGNNYDGGSTGIGGPGGAGGAALGLAAAEIVIDGDILADGAAGGASILGNFAGGGGGGAGGAVSLIADRVVVAGRLTAAGGAGGDGQNGSVGGVGGDGFVRVQGAELEVGGEVTPEPIVRDGICGQQAVFDFTGAPQDFVVPPGVTRLYLQAWGAQAGASESCVEGEPRQEDGGLGGYAAGILQVRPGEALRVYVGGKPNLELAGVTPGGWNGGGDAGQYGGAGGGATDLRRAGDDLANRVLVAGGGGGGNTGCPDHGTGGAGGGVVGGDGIDLVGRQPGLGATQDAGGAGGEPDGPQLAVSGALGQGGGAAIYHFSGGGGGYYGGGNAYACGAGGGSSYLDGVEQGETRAGQNTGHGRMIITW